jgi:hypothetical protein
MEFHHQDIAKNIVSAANLHPSSPKARNLLASFAWLKRWQP